MTSRVLCISRGAVERFYFAHKEGWFCEDEEALAYFRKLVDIHSLFVLRERAEHDAGFVQLIPSCVVLAGSKILCLQRAAKSARHELKSKMTTLFGGHVDEEDKQTSGIWETLLTAAAREVREELGIKVSSEQLQFKGLAIDPVNPAGRIHLGVVFLFHSESDEVRLHNGLDLGEFEVSRARTVRFYSPVDVRRSGSNFDPWSTLFLRSIYPALASSCSETELDELPLVHAAAM